MTFWYDYLWTALLWFFLSALTLWVMVYVLEESLKIENRKHELRLSFKELNVFSQIKKWGKLETIRYTLIMKIFVFVAFLWYTSLSTLYLIDFFGFQASKVGYYLTFTGLFLIFHQSITIRFFLTYFKDRKSLLIWLGFMGFGFMWMWLSQEIILFTVFYFFSVLGISLCFTTLWALTSRAVWEKDQWEVMWMMTGVDSFLSIGVPVLSTIVYSHIHFSFYFIVAILPLMALVINRVFFSATEFRKRKKA